MLSTRPPTLPLGEDDPEADYLKAQEAFRELYLTRVVVDVRGIRVSFVEDDCAHVCFKEKPGPKPPFKQAIRELWRPDRAARIPWIDIALKNHSEVRIRPSPVTQERGRLSYSIVVPADSKAGLDQEYFAVFVRPSPDPGMVHFITAYSMDQTSFDRLKQGGPQIYPAKAKAKKSGRK